MAGDRKIRREPDPDRPGTVYRSKPKFGRRAEGSPHSLRDETAETPPVPAGARPVGSVYNEHGGSDRPGYGQLYDDRGLPGESGRPYPPPPPARSSRRRRPPLRLIVPVVVLLLVLYPVLLGWTAWSSLNRVDALDPAHQVADTADTPGRNYLVVGSDSRSALTKAERKKLGTGSAAGQRTDTIMILHVPSGGGPTVLVSVPRDSYVPIPGHAKNKINAAYAFGGAPLLVRTIESVTGLRIDEYVETGLGGFADVVDALGGVTLCPKFAMKDKDAHINLKKGCQQMDGKTALGYARARHSDPRGDLGRVERQRETLAAIAKKMLGPSTLIQPWKSFPSAKAGGGALTVDEGTTPVGLAKFVLAMRAVAGGQGVSMTVPVSNPDLRTSAGSAVQWNRTEALELFSDLKKDDTEAVKKLADKQK
jgi:LCP family protein required for cell wall assembly